MVSETLDPWSWFVSSMVLVLVLVLYDCNSSLGRQQKEEYDRGWRKFAVSLSKEYPTETFPSDSICLSIYDPDQTNVDVSETIDLGMANSCVQLDTTGISIPTRLGKYDHHLLSCRSDNSKARLEFHGMCPWVVFHDFFIDGSLPSFFFESLFSRTLYRYVQGVSGRRHYDVYPVRMNHPTYVTLFCYFTRVSYPCKIDLFLLVPGTSRLI